jgi:hypothetical protein
MGAYNEAPDSETGPFMSITECHRHLNNPLNICKKIDRSVSCTIMLKGTVICIRSMLE